MSLPPLPELRRRCEALLSGLAAAEQAHKSGLPAAGAPSAAELLRAHHDLGEPETFLRVRELREGLPAGSDERRRMAMLLELLADIAERCATAEVDSNRARQEKSTGVSAVGSEIPLWDAMAAVLREPGRARRAAFAHAAEHAAEGFSDLLAGKVEKTIALAGRLGYTSYEAMRDDVSGFALGPLADEATVALAETEEAYRDLAEHLLRAQAEGARPGPRGDAERHDLLYVCHLRALAPLLSTADVLPALSRWTSELGLQLSAGGRIEIDIQERSGKFPFSFLTALSIPGEIHVGIRPTGGGQDFHAALHELGRAFSLAHVGPEAKLEHKRAADASLLEGYGMIFDHLLLDPRFLTRYGRLPDSSARRAAQLFAFKALFTLRRLSAKLISERVLYREGPGRAARQAYRDGQASALKVGWPEGLLPMDVDPRFHSARYLRAIAFEAAAFPYFQQSFDEDYWRNPRFGEALRTLFAPGGREDAAALCERGFGRKLALSEAVKRLLRALG